jgi:hypothetical protein
MHTCLWRILEQGLIPKHIPCIERNLYIRQLPYIVLAKVEVSIPPTKMTFASLLLIPSKEKLIAYLIPSLVAERQLERRIGKCRSGRA